MKNKKREAMMIAAATAALLAMGITTNAEDKVLNFGCAMYTDGVVNSAMDENGGWNAMRYGIAETLFKFDDNMEVTPWLAESYEVNDEHTEWTPVFLIPRSRYYEIRKNQNRKIPSAKEPFCCRSGDRW